MFDLLGRVNYSGGEAIFRFGEQGDSAYLIESGWVAIEFPHSHRQVIGPGELFGEIALIDRGTRTATATALEQTRLVQLPRDLVESKLTDADPLIRHLLLLVLERFRATHQRLEGGPLPAGDLARNDLDRSANFRRHAVAHVQMVHDINEAMQAGQFELFYQPIASSADASLSGFEALIRWHHPRLGFLPPLEFLDVAEATGQIVPLGLWTLRQASEDIRKLNARAQNNSNEPLFVSVNVSARQLGERGQSASFIDFLSQHSVAPSTVRLEVTETALIQDPETAQQALKELRAEGFRVALDDFGTGYSSLSYLQQYPVDAIKIDRQFISRMLKEDSSMQIVLASVRLAEALGLDVVAEGVESEAEMSHLANMHCKYSQGYYLSKPMPLAAALEYVDRQAQRDS